jgi:hypothetical protein
LTDAKTKKLVATVLPGFLGESGLLGSNGNFYPDAAIVLQWEVDKKFAFVSISGVG